MQYWTSRGFAVLDVNYGGSTGYGRAYRERLEGQWGIVDVDDCVNGARYLVRAAARSIAQRLAIRGGSAGGYTTLCALAFRDVFSAGASYYGVSDLEALARGHAQVRVALPGPPGRPLPGAPRPLRRSARRSTTSERLLVPGDLLPGAGGQGRAAQPGGDDGRRAAAQGAAGGLPGLRGRAARLPPGREHQARAGAELYFYSRVFGFTLADPIEPVEIENLEG